MIVANRIDGDSRVQKSAHSLSEAGWDVHLIGVSPSGKNEKYKMGDVTIHRLPVPRMAAKTWAQQLPKKKYPLAYQHEYEAADALRRVELNLIDLEERAAAYPSRARRLLSPRYLKAKATGALYRSWLQRRARLTEKFTAMRKSPEHSPGQAHVEAFEVALWSVLQPKTYWRRLDVTAHRFELAFREKILELAPDVIHSHDIRPLGIAVRCANHLKFRGRKTAVVYDAHEYIRGLEDFAGRLRKSLESYEAGYIKKVDEVVTVSPHIADALKRRYRLKKTPKVVLNTPVSAFGSTDDLEYPDVRAACGLGSGPPLGVYCGGANPERNLETIIKAVAELPDFHMAFVINSLSSTYAKSLMELGNSLGISDRLHFMTYVPYDVLPKFMSTADVGVHPMRKGIRNHELALPNKYFEYMHAKLPVAVSDLPAMAGEIAELGHGEVFDPDEPATLAAAIRKILGDKAAYRQAYADPEVLRERSWEHQAATYLEMYEGFRGRITPRSSKSKRSSIGKQKAIRELREHGARLAVAVFPAHSPLIGTLGALLKEYPEVTVDLLSSIPNHRRILETFDEQGFGDRVSVVDHREKLREQPIPYRAVITAGGGSTEPHLHLPPVLADFFKAGTPILVGGDGHLAAYAKEKNIGLAFEPESDGSLARAIASCSYRSFNTGKFAERRRYGTATPWPTTSGNAARLWMGPANYAGQLTNLAAALGRSRPDVSSWVSSVTSPHNKIQYPVDRKLKPWEQKQVPAQLGQVEKVLSWSTHVIADAFRPVFGTLHGDDIEADLPVMLRAGKQIALLAHGSEVRSPERHLAEHSDSLFRDAPEDVLETLKEVTARNKRIALETGLPHFVTTPDLLSDLPEAIWLPLIVDTDRWANDFTVMERQVPRVVHAPSRRWTKGTDRVLPYFERLHEAGHIEFILLEKMTPSDVHAAVMEADVIVDQFSIGAYGTFACEGMAAGKPVLAYLSPDLSEAIGAKPPIVNCTADSISSAMESLLDDRDLARQIGTESVRFAKTYHNGEMTVRKLGAFLEPVEVN